MSSNMTFAPFNEATVAADDMLVTSVESLDYEGRGVARVAGKVVFIEGALPGEVVRFHYHKKRKRHDTGHLLEVLQPSPDRVTPPCMYFGTCGGCSLQHLRAEAQWAAKQRVVAEQLEHIGSVQPERWLPPITGPVWGYRRRARLGIRLVPKKGGVLVGFREKRRTYITNLDNCLVLAPPVAALLTALRELVSRLSCPHRLPQIEVAVGDDAAALVFRHLEPLTPTDIESLRAFGERHNIQIHLQPGGVESVYGLWPPHPPALAYRLSEFDLTVAFRPTDFVQVNNDINRQTVTQAIALLDLRKDDRVLDLFCGLGNFTLPLARRAGCVLGVDAEAGLLTEARRNAAANGLANVEFCQSDLYALDTLDTPWQDFTHQKLLLDPPRSGAIEALNHLSTPGPERILYVSCYPATLARDSHYLVHERGYRLHTVSIMDMFPQTSHVESMALFVRE